MSEHRCTLQTPEELSESSVHFSKVDVQEPTDSLELLPLIMQCCIWAASQAKIGLTVVWLIYILLLYPVLLHCLCFQCSFQELLAVCKQCKRGRISISPPSGRPVKQWSKPSRRTHDEGPLAVEENNLSYARTKAM